MDPLKFKQGQQIGLMQAMQFTIEDLDANRSGLLSDGQRLQIQLGQIWGALGWWFLAVIGTIQLVNPGDWFPENPANRLVCLVMVLTGLGMAFWRQSQVNQTLKSNRVAEATGPIVKTQHKDRDQYIYHVYIATKTFEIKSALYQALTEGEHYTLYYMAGTERLLSAELTQDLEKEKRLAEPEVTSDTEMLSTEETESQQLSRESQG